jgi:hypothetical protein
MKPMENLHALRQFAIKNIPYVIQYLRIVGIRGLMAAIGCKIRKTHTCFEMTRSDLRFPLYLRIPSSDVPAYDQMFLLQEYDFDVKHLPKTIIDAGANIGLSSEREVFYDPSRWIGNVGALIVELHERLKPGCNRSFYNATTEFDEEWHHGENEYLTRKDGCLAKRVL